MSDTWFCATCGEVAIDHYLRSGRDPAHSVTPEPMSSGDAFVDEIKRQRDESVLAIDAAFRDGKLEERARCRAIVARLFSNDWKGNQALEEIDNG